MSTVNTEIINSEIIIHSYTLGSSPEKSKNNFPIQTSNTMIIMALLYGAPRDVPAHYNLIFACGALTLRITICRNCYCYLYQIQDASFFLSSALTTCVPHATSPRLYNSFLCSFPVSCRLPALHEIAFICSQTTERVCGDQIQKGIADALHAEDIPDALLCRVIPKRKRRRRRTAELAGASSRVDRSC